MKFKTRGNRTIPVRGNPSIWLVAEWLHNVVMSTKGSLEQFPFNKNDINESYNDNLYDKAAEFMKKLQLNEFTGDDNHGD